MTQRREQDSDRVARLDLGRRDRARLAKYHNVSRPRVTGPWVGNDNQTYTKLSRTSKKDGDKSSEQVEAATKPSSKLTKRKCFPVIIYEYTQRLTIMR